MAFIQRSVLSREVREIQYAKNKANESELNQLRKIEIDMFTRHVM
jgi:hypothetical protein